MKKQKGSDYYLKRKSKLLKEFDKILKHARKVLIPLFGEELTDTMAKEVRTEYEALIPDLPYIGGKQPHTQFLQATAQALALYRVAQKRGISLEQTGILFYQMSREVLRSYPKFGARLLGRITFTRRYIKGLQKRATESQQRRYPEDYVYVFVPGDGEDFDYGVDYLECGGCKFLKEHGAPELGQYLCLADILYSEMFGWGLVRTKTLAQGDDKCDFRFKRGGRTRVAVPEAVRQQAIDFLPLASGL